MSSGVFLKVEKTVQMLRLNKPVIVVKQSFWKTVSPLQKWKKQSTTIQGANESKIPVQNEGAYFHFKNRMFDPSTSKARC